MAEIWERYREDIVKGGSRCHIPNICHVRQFLRKWEGQVKGNVDTHVVKKHPCHARLLQMSFNNESMSHSQLSDDSSEIQDSRGRSSTMIDRTSELRASDCMGHKKFAIHGKCSGRDSVTCPLQYLIDVSCGLMYSKNIRYQNCYKW